MTVTLPDVRIRPANPTDAAAVAVLAGTLARSFPFSPAAFQMTFAALLRTEGAGLLVAVEQEVVVGYLLGFRHLTFYANGPVAVVEEIVVRDDRRGLGIGRALMGAFEQWAGSRECRLVALATRRAAGFYLAIGYEESATYLRKVLPS
jgi:GNAT superfamily N-acetyltransferase